LHFCPSHKIPFLWMERFHLSLWLTLCVQLNWLLFIWKFPSNLNSKSHDKSIAPNFEISKSTIWSPKYLAKFETFKIAYTLWTIIFLNWNDVICRNCTNECYTMLWLWDQTVVMIVMIVRCDFTYIEPLLSFSFSLFFLDRVFLFKLWCTMY